MEPRVIGIASGYLVSEKSRYLADPCKGSILGLYNDYVLFSRFAREILRSPAVKQSNSRCGMYSVLPRLHGCPEGGSCVERKSRPLGG